jgi:hypothetical protein
MGLSLLRVSGGFCGADRYSKQQLQVWSQHKVKTLVYGTASGTARTYGTKTWPTTHRCTSTGHELINYTQATQQVSFTTRKTRLSPRNPYCLLHGRLKCIYTYSATSHAPSFHLSRYCRTLHLHVID